MNLVHAHIALVQIIAHCTGCLYICLGISCSIALHFTFRLRALPSLVKKSVAQFTKYHTIYRTIVVSLSQDRLAIVTLNVIKFILGIS